MADDVANGAVQTVMVQPGGLVIDVCEERAQRGGGVGDGVDALGGGGAEHLHACTARKDGEVRDDGISERVGNAGAVHPVASEIAVPADR